MHGFKVHTLQEKSLHKTQLVLSTVNFAKLTRVTGKILFHQLLKQLSLHRQLSFFDGHCPPDFIHVFVSPIVKPGSDLTDFGSYRPIANLEVLSKLFERMVAQRIWEYLQQFELLPVGQSGFPPGHSSETAIRRVFVGFIGCCIWIEVTRRHSVPFSTYQQRSTLLITTS
jgi:hypothetical protein